MLFCGRIFRGLGRFMPGERVCPAISRFECGAVDVSMACRFIQ